MKYARYIPNVDKAPFTRRKIGDNLNNCGGIWCILHDIEIHLKYTFNVCSESDKDEIIVYIYELDDNFIVQKEYQFSLNEIKQLMIFS